MDRIGTSQRAARSCVKQRKGACALAFAAWTFLGAVAHGQCQYEVTAIIQAPPCPFVGPPSTFAAGMSSDGRVAGRYDICGTAFNEAFVWTPNPPGSPTPATCDCGRWPARRMPTPTRSL